MMQDKDLTDDVLDEIIAGAKTSMEQYLALSLKAERANRQQSAQQNIPENIPTLREAVDTIRSSGISIDAEKILAERDALNSPVIPDGWIPVSERMPENATGVLVASPWQCAPGGYAMKWAVICPGHPDADIDGWIIPGASWSPTHWMPLPAAPQQGGK